MNVKLLCKPLRFVCLIPLDKKKRIFRGSVLNFFNKQAKNLYAIITNRNSITVLAYFHKSFTYNKSAFFKLLLNCYTVMLGIFDYVINKALTEIGRSQLSDFHGG